ncbi:MAG: nitrilase-related carbon-nitrogen hydrolase, partial [Limisphaerales bacterium]
MRIGLANLRPGETRDESLQLALEAMSAAKEQAADIICFPECYVPGYRTEDSTMPVEAPWLEQAWATIDRRAGELEIA